jgi:hypothetical protein
MPKGQRKTGRPKGAPHGTRNHVTDGMRSAVMTEHRKKFWALMQRAGEAIKASRAGASGGNDGAGL